MEKTLTGKETLQTIIDLVDINKVKLPSYTISMKKFDTIADAYTKITYLMCMVNVTKDTDEEVKSAAIKFINKINANPQFYSYSNMNSVEKNHIEDVTASFFPNYKGDTQIEHLKRTFRTKNLKDTLFFLLDNLRVYMEKLPEELIWKALCTDYVNECIVRFNSITDEQKPDDADNGDNANNEQEKPDEPSKSDEPSKPDEPIKPDEEIVKSEEKPVKKSFWKRLFGR